MALHGADEVSHEPILADLGEEGNGEVVGPKGMGEVEVVEWATTRGSDR